jgi:hypothetical protein
MLLPAYTQAAQQLRPVTFGPIASMTAASGEGIHPLSEEDQPHRRQVPVLST